MADETITEEKHIDSEGYEKQIGAGMWLPENIGDTLKGEIAAIETDGLYGKQLVVLMEDGNEIKTPSHKVLQARIAKAKVDDKIKIVYTGEQPPAVRGNNPTKMYDVFLKTV